MAKTASTPANKGSSRDGAKKKKNKHKHNKPKDKPRHQSSQKSATKSHATAPPQATVSSTTTTSNTTTVKGHCDICLTRHSKTKTLLECQTCHVKVHDICYGVPDNFLEDPNYAFHCLACQAVGKQVKIRERDPYSGRRKVVIQESRPQECCLCSIKHGVHAMHPVYDVHGKYGRQILLPPDKAAQGGKRKLAWGHTLCLQGVNLEGIATGCFYGCRADGYCDEDEYSLGDDESINSELDIPSEKNSSGVHHYVCWGWLGQEDEYTKNLQEAKKCRCIYCGKKDDGLVIMNNEKVFRSLRVTVQCCANNEDEVEELTRHHARGGEPCYQAMHIGCAMWSRNEANEIPLWRRVYLSTKPLQGAVVAVYCDLHAKDLYRGEVPGSSVEDILAGPYDEDAAAGNQKSKKRIGPGTLARQTSKAAGGNPIIPGHATIPKRPSKKGGGVNVADITMKTYNKRQELLDEAGKAVAIQTKKHGRLVREPSATPAKVVHSAELPKEDEASKVRDEFLLQLLTTLQLEIDNGKLSNQQFKDPKITSKLRVKWSTRWQNQCNLPDGDFAAVWKEAKKAVISQKAKALKKEVKNRLKSFELSRAASAAVDDEKPPASEEEAPSPPIKPSRMDSEQGSVDPADLSHSENSSRGGSSGRSNPFLQAMIQRSADELLAQLERAGQLQGHEERQLEAIKVAKTYKKCWKRTCGLPETEYHLFSDVLKIVNDKCSWLELAAKGKEPSEERAANNRPPVEKERTTSRPRKRKSIADTTLESLAGHSSADSTSGVADLNHAGHQNNSDQENDETYAQPNSTLLPGYPFTELPPPPSRWSHLSYGPYFKNDGFHFDKWDTYEELPSSGDGA